jgi:hypothetical protein
MQNREQFNPSSPAPTGPSASSADRRSGTTTPDSAFAPGFLEKLRLLCRRLEEQDSAPSTEPEALVSGPLTTERVSTPGGARHAVVLEGEPLSAGGKSAGMFFDRGEALRAAAVFPAVAAPSPYHLKDRPKSLGWPLHCCDRHVGHVGRLAECRRRALLGHLHVARYLATHPHALALLLESVGPEALPLLGRVLARRIEEALP